MAEAHYEWGKALTQTSQFDAARRQFQSTLLLARQAGAPLIEAHSLRNRGGEAVAKPIEEGLLREDGRVLYVVDDGIPVMLEVEARKLSENEKEAWRARRTAQP